MSFASGIHPASYSHPPPPRHLVTTAPRAPFDLTALYTQGTVTLTAAVPEPSTCLLLIAATPFLLRRRSRH